MPEDAPTIRNLNITDSTIERLKNSAFAREWLLAQEVEVARLEEKLDREKKLHQQANTMRIQQQDRDVEEIARLREEAEKLRDQLKYATTFTLQYSGNYVGKPTQTIMVERRDLDAWVVFNGTACLNRDGEWESEPRLSQLTDEVKQRTRYSFDEAWKLGFGQITPETIGGNRDE